jgi:hypothetical protein
MNIIETGKVLAKIQLGDNRDVDDRGLVLRELHDSIGKLDFEDAIAAVTMHRQTSTAYLMPAHIIENVRLIHAREDRAERVQSARERGQITRPRSTFDRAQFDADTQIALAAARAERAAKEAQS